MRIVVNTISTKKHSGGAYQIAYNFLLETLADRYDIEWLYLTSEDVDIIVGEQFESLRGKRYFVFPTQPDFFGSYWRVRQELARWEDKYKPDVIYSISSPCYFSFKTPEVMRFANAWVTNPNKESWHSLDWKKKCRTWLYCANQRRLLRGAKYIITQSETVKKGLIKLTSLSENHICVVPNVLPKVFQAEDVNKSLESGWIDIACVAAPVPHKNLMIIPEVLRLLRDNLNLTNVRFHLTIPKDDPMIKRILAACKANNQEERIINHGRCTQRQLCEIYNKSIICFLPSLLETFSASSLEAMYFGLGIIASDFGFNREVIADAGLYFSPLDASDAASCIERYINRMDLRQALQSKMAERLKLYYCYENHFLGILNFLKQVGDNVI